MKLFFTILVVAVAFLAAIGATCTLLADGHYLFAIVNAGLAAMAAPYVIEKVKDFMEK